MPEPKVVSMERTPAEKKKAEEACKAMPCEGPDYPWGLCINLGKDELAKLGVKDLPEVGQEFHIFGAACVTRVSQSASQEGDESMGVELQITALGIMAEDEASEDITGMSRAAAKLYGTVEKAEGEA
jgi:hypothetical protein